MASLYIYSISLSTLNSGIVCVTIDYTICYARLGPRRIYFKLQIQYNRPVVLNLVVLKQSMKANHGILCVLF